MTDEKTPEISGPLADLALVTITGTGKVTWPDGTEVSADQFQNAVTAAVTGFQKGQAAGRREALQEARDYLSEQEQFDAAELVRTMFTTDTTSGACTCGYVWAGHPNPHAITCPQHAEPERDEEGPALPLSVLCNSCGRALANVGEWCCNRFTTAADVTTIERDHVAEAAALRKQVEG